MKQSFISKATRKLLSIFPEKMQSIFYYYLKAFNAKIFKRTWVIYNYFAIDYSKPLPSNAINTLSKLCDYFSKTSGFRPSDGTLLGLFREGELIKHDNDLDFDVFYSDEVARSISSYMKQNHYQLGRKVYYCNSLQQLCYWNNEGIIVDFIFWHQGMHYLVNFSEEGYVKYMPKKFLFNLSEYKISGISFKGPCDKFEWLKFRYGEDWSVPHNEKSDWKQTASDLVDIEI